MKQRIRQQRRRYHARRDPDALSWSEAERLARTRMWGPILDLPPPKGGDDMYPRPPQPDEDRYR